ncbi:hypothetical protein [Streptomyces sp. AcE210]|uniref:hypothetical protein n=1 Tax=Streptomyces sp. AcE210 TaxID=2292703 RepID=UPI001F0BD1EC|nr:hypothetical protein [Streptomyces sp. AcE210]
MRPSSAANDLTVVPSVGTTVYEERSFRSITANFAGSTAPEVPTIKCPSMTASSRRLGSFSISLGTTEVNVCVSRSKANRDALLAPPPPARTLPAPKKTVVSEAATALARVAFGSGVPRSVTVPVAGSYSHRTGAFPGAPPTA